MDMARFDVKCQCGQAIPGRNITQRGSYLMPADRPQGYAYFKFRCPRCRKMGEQFFRADPPQAEAEPPAA